VLTAQQLFMNYEKQLSRRVDQIKEQLHKKGGTLLEYRKIIVKQF